MIQQTAKPDPTIPSVVSALVSRLAAIAIAAAAFGYYIYRNMLANSLMTRAVYVAQEAAAYDDLYAEPPAEKFVAAVIVAVIVAGFLLLLYELLAFGIRKLIADPLVRAIFPTAQ